MSNEDKTRKRRSLPYEKKKSHTISNIKKLIKAYQTATGDYIDISKELSAMGLTVGKQKEIKGKLKDKNFFGMDIKKLKKGITKFPSKKGKPHLKHGGKAKKKYGVIGKPTLRKGGKAK